MKKTNLILTLLLTAGPLFAKGGGSSAGLTLLRTSGARVSALGNAGAAIRNDITALGFNPASLGSLSSMQVSLFHEEGFSDDAYSQIMAGSKLPLGAFGVSAGRYDGGEIQLHDGVNPVRSVTAQQDLVLN